MTQTINYITGLYNQVKTLYNNESINTVASEIFVWSTTSPYTGTNSSTMLNQFLAYRNGFNGNIAMLFVIQCEWRYCLCKYPMQFQSGL